MDDSDVTVILDTVKSGSKSSVSSSQDAFDSNGFKAGTMVVTKFAPTCMDWNCPNVVLCLLFTLVVGCSQSSTAFMPVGDNVYPANSDDFEVMVFDDGATPEKEYEIIGIVYTSSEDIHFSKDRDDLISKLKREAKKHGADAIMDIRIMESSNDGNSFHDPTDPDYRSCEAKAIVFKK